MRNEIDDDVTVVSDKSDRKKKCIQWMNEWKKKKTRQKKGIKKQQIVRLPRATPRAQLLSQNCVCARLPLENTQPQAEHSIQQK